MIARISTHGETGTARPRKRKAVRYYAVRDGDYERALRAAGYTDEDIKRMRAPERADREIESPFRRRGRASKWTSDIQARLVIEILELIGGEGCRNERGVSDACRQLAKQEFWIKFVRPTKNRNIAEILRERFVRSSNGALNVFVNTNPNGHPRYVVAIRQKSPRRGGKYG